MQVRCIRCKGRSFCGRVSCPHITKYYSIKAAKEKIEGIDYSNLSSQSPAPFIGRVGYPYINAGMLALPDKQEQCFEYDAPREWSKKNYSIKKVADLRSTLINSRIKTGIMETNKFVNAIQEIGIASKPVDVEVKLTKKPMHHLSFSQYTAPTGATAEMSYLDLTSNPRVHPCVEKAVSDDDAKAFDAVYELYNKGIDEHALGKLLSVGMLGVKKDRKLVPTRWSITATDDQLGKILLSDIKDYSEMDYQAYFGGYLGNYYLILCFPDIWSYELFEMYMPKASFNSSDEIQFSTDYEAFSGRKQYAYNCAGAYYASKLAILEKMKSLKRQGSVLVLRIITGEYTMPLGVWVCREATRKSLESNPIFFSDRNLMLNYAKSLVKKKFGYDVDKVLSQSIIIKNLTSQPKLSAFFN